MLHLSDHHHHIIGGAVIDQEVSLPVIYSSPGRVELSAQESITVGILSVLWTQYLQDEELHYVQENKEQRHAGNDIFSFRQGIMCAHLLFSYIVYYPSLT